MRAVIVPLLVALVAVLALLALPACSAEGERFDEAKTIIADRCAACHTVPGVRRAHGEVGPPLNGIGRRQILAGYFPNSRANLTRWIAHPQAMLPGNAMPDPGLTPRQAQLVADYLYTLD